MSNRKDITSEVEETSSVELSHNLTTVTTEIKAYQAIGGQAIFEIGRRLKWVKENDLAHGEFGKWLESIHMDRTAAVRFIKVTETFSNDDTYHHLGVQALYLISTMPAEERDKPQQLSSGEVKKPDEMTVRELREIKRKLADAYAENSANQTLLSQANQQTKRLQDQVDQLQQRDPDIKQVEVEPADYQEIKTDLKAANAKINDLQTLVDNAADDETKRLEYELELKNAKEDREDLQADLRELADKRQNLLDQNAQIREVQEFVKQGNKELDLFATLLNRIDTTVLPDDSSMIQGLTEMADKLEEAGQKLHEELDSPYQVG